MLTLFRMLLDEVLLVEGGCPLQNDGRLTGVGWSDEGDLSEKRILRHCQDEPNVNVLAPCVGTLNQIRIRSK